jgi:hypothetical protein
MHQFAPGSAAIHCNENLSDEEAEWYMQRYPYIKALFAPPIPEGGIIEGQPIKSVDLKRGKNRDKGEQI